MEIFFQALEEPPYLTVFSFSQEENAPKSIVLTVEGIYTLVRDVQPLKV